MGLSLRYELRLPFTTTAQDVEHLLLDLRRFALLQPFADVSPLLSAARDRDRDRADIEPRWSAALQLWARLIAEPCDHASAPLHGDVRTARAFFVDPGRGCETASFGLLSRASASGDGAEWFWRCSCKTQYASAVSEDHLVRCHTSLVDVLEHAIALGADVIVDDETHYWQTRDTTRLVEEVRKMNRLIAHFAGAFSGARGRDRAGWTGQDGAGP